MAGEGEDAPLMNGSEDTVVMSQLHRETAKEGHTGRVLDLRRKDLPISIKFLSYRWSTNAIWLLVSFMEMHLDTLESLHIHR